VAARGGDTLESRRLSPVLGTELTLADLFDLDSATVEALLAALDQYALLLFRGQRLSPEDLIAITRRFGVPERFPEARATDEFPEVCIVTNDPRQAPTQPVYWHTDGAQQPEPPSLSLFYAVRTPRSGGETLFADARDAYDSLPAGLRERIDGRRAILPSGLEQPLVRVHPRSGRRAIYADFGRTVGITGLDRDDAKALLRALRDHVTRPGAVYAHSWAPGELALWDNASLLHSATSPDATDGRRLMWRTSVRGESVIPG
jgi:alpha-ketoglutarate-dependent taurine dioxygenase